MPIALGLLAMAIAVQGLGLLPPRSPVYTEMYQHPLPIPPVAVPDYTTTTDDGRKVQHFTSYIKPFSHKVYSGRGDAHLIGFNGTAPGPTYIIEKGTETIVRVVNQGKGVSSTHLHGSETHSVWDGWASDLLQPGQYKDYYYPNRKAASLWYHDHADKRTGFDAYYGQAGIYIIRDPAEEAMGLPQQPYDIPLALNDKIYQDNGDLSPPDGNPANFFGDVMQVNEQPWPYLKVEPRKYRLRFFDMSLSRPYKLYFFDEHRSSLDFQIIASDGGLFSGPVSAQSFLIAPGERYEVVIDFAGYAGQNLTLGNMRVNSLVDLFDNSDQIMRFVVGDRVADWTNNEPVPSTLNTNIEWPAARSQVDHHFNFQMGGESMWTINGVGFDDVKNRVLARPPQGTVELWEMSHTGGMAVHPVHVHLVGMQVVSRTGGLRGVAPYESAGLKDVVLLQPGETVQVRAIYGPWNGLYMFHCHNLKHEDNTMLDVFNVTHLSELGYKFDFAQGFADPMDTRFAPKPYNADDFTTEAIAEAVKDLTMLNPYSAAKELLAAEAAHYKTAGYHGDATPVHPASTTTAAVMSSGVGFPFALPTRGFVAPQMV
ncbi:Cupredoxin [Piedraia hortae CBS 480.64]|uniref:Cupredoxin n=1 Tax=Piedraia hortae CBS 480.64 TaxID=1314780 RepID=A0A6A7BTR9_9PEZI|nr:Cupredoxin [Piedraia hortae CBS 480.64]